MNLQHKLIKSISYNKWDVLYFTQLQNPIFLIFLSNKVNITSM